MKKGETPRPAPAGGTSSYGRNKRTLARTARARRGGTPKMRRGGGGKFNKKDKSPEGKKKTVTGVEGTQPKTS